MSALTVNGRLSRTGVRTKTAWFTALVPGANMEMFCNVQDMSQAPVVEARGSAGQINLRTMKRTREEPAPRILIPNAQYTGAGWLPYAHLMGLDTVTIAAPLELHKFTFVNEPQKHFTMASALEDKEDTYVAGDALVEWNGVKPISAEISNTDEGFVQIEYETIANMMRVTSDAGILVTADNFNTLTPVDLEKQICLDDCEIQINDQTGAALGSGDIVSVTDFNLRVSRPTSRRHLRGGPTTRFMSSEPLQNEGYSEVLFGFNLDRYGEDADAVSALTNVETLKKARLIMLATIGGVNFNHTFFMTKMQKMSSTSELVGGNGIPLEHQYRVLRAATAPTGETDLYFASQLSDQFATSYTTL